MMPSIERKRLALLLLPALLAGCSGLISKYGMESYRRFKVSEKGHYLIPANMTASGPFSHMSFEGVARIKDIEVDPRIFQDSSILPFARDVEAHFHPGSDSALLFYRNYVTFCCDGHSVGSFLVFLGYHEGRIDPARSFITEAGSIAPPHYTWWPRKIITRDSSFYIEAYQDSRDTVKPYWFDIFHKGVTESGLENYARSKMELRKLIRQNTDLVKE